MYDSYNTRFATEKEKEELFKVIKDNGYEWNPETKILEKLIESKEDTNDKIVMSGIYFDREIYADEVELHLGNYEIENRDGKTYAVFKNQETKNSKPKFKVGDRIKCKGLDIVNPIEISAVSPRIYTFTNGSFQYIEIVDKDYELIINKPKFKVGDRIRYVGDDFPIKIIDIKNNQYHIECFCDKHNVNKIGIIPVSQQDNYMLIPKFDITTLKPYDKVLVRDTKEQVWVADLFSHMINRPFGGYTFACVGHYPNQCIPYEGNEHLLGTTDDCDEYFNLIS